jgi:hypothetical protein
MTAAEAELFIFMVRASLRPSPWCFCRQKQALVANTTDGDVRLINLKRNKLDLAGKFFQSGQTEAKKIVFSR